ncbi:hypothetical protein ACFQU2_19675 [Siccirubricoccus deserti]|nr:hypothetical protein [Siccirubricoccus deserti]
MVKALARAHRWKRLLEEGRYASLSEMARAEKIDRGYLGKMLRLTLLASDIVEDILNGRLSPDLGATALRDFLSAVWAEQRASVTETAAALPHEALHGSSGGEPPARAP